MLQWQNGRFHNGKGHWFRVTNTAQTHISLFRPYLDEREVQAVSEVLRSGWLGQGPRTEEFENQFTAYTGAAHTVAVNSCTSALSIAMQLLGVGPGDEVIVPALTFVATAHAVAFHGARPVFCDIDPETLNLDIEDAASRITPRTRAVLPVHYGGRPVALDRLRSRIGPDLPVIEDAAHACGAQYQGRRIGGHGNIACFSFQAVKNLTAGDGGAVTFPGGRDHDMDRARVLRWLGINRDTWDRTKLPTRLWWQYEVDAVTLKYQMNDIAAAMALVQLDKLPSMNARRKAVALRYTDGFRDNPRIKTPLQDSDDSASSWHIYALEVDRRDDLHLYLKEQRIDSGVHYKPVHMYGIYGTDVRLPAAEAAYPRLLSLPMHPGLSDDDVDRVIHAVNTFTAHT